MRAPASTAESPATAAPDAFLEAVGGRALLFAELCSGPGQAAPALVGRAMQDWNRRRRRSDPASWDRLFWRALQIRFRPDASPAPAAADAGLGPALRALPPRQRQAFLLRVWLGFELPVVAELLGVDETSAGRLLVGSLRQLRAQLGVAEGDERWLRHGRAALDLRAGTLALSRRAVLAAARSRALAAAPRHRQLWWALVPVALLALLTGQRLQPPVPAAPPGTPERSLDSSAVVPVQPLEQLLSLPEEDFALLAGPAPFELLAELEFQLWRREQVTDAH